MEQVSLKLHLFRSYLWSKTASLLIGFALFFYNSGVLYSTLEKAMATHSRILAWRIPGTEEPGGLPCMGLHRVGHGWSDLAAAAAVAVGYFWRLCSVLFSQLLVAPEILGMGEAHHIQLKYNSLNAISVYLWPMRLQRQVIGLHTPNIWCWNQHRKTAIDISVQKWGKWESQRSSQSRAVLG